MTIGEAVRVCDAYLERQKERAYFDYTQAMTVGFFIGSMFSSREPPKLEDIYPEFYKPEEEEKQKAEEAEAQRRADLSAARFIKFAVAFNRRYEANGNRSSESENRG